MSSAHLPQLEVQFPICPCRRVEDLHAAFSSGFHAGGASDTKECACPILPVAHSQSRKVNSWMTAHSRTAQSETLPSLSVTHSCWPTSAEPQRWPSRAALSPGTSPRGQRALKEPSVLTKSWGFQCRYRCRLLLAEIPKGSDRNAELKTASTPLESGSKPEVQHSSWCYEREQGRRKTGIASLPHVKLAPTSAPGPTGERQEHLDAIVAFAGAGQRRRLFRGRDILTIKWAIGDLPKQCRFFFNTQLMFLKKEKDPTTKLFDDDDWIRSLAEAQETTADISEDRVTPDQEGVDPQKTVSIRW